MPPTGLGALFVVLAFVPGWLYLNWASRLRLPAKRSPLHETLQLIAVGVMTTGPAVLLFVLVPHRWIPFAIDVSAWASQGPDYLQSNVRRAAMSVIVVLFFAVVIARAYFWIVSKRVAHGPEFPESGSVWVHAIGTRPEDRVVFLGLQLTDGTLIEGFLHSQTTTDASDNRDMALSRPIFVSPPGGNRQSSPVDRVVVPAREIRIITVLELPKAESLAAS